MENDKKNSQGKRWCFTFNNYTEEIIEYIVEDVFPRTLYGIFGLEIGDKGTPHLQGYLHFNTNQRFNTMIKKILPGAHFELAIGNAEQNKAYCTKQQGVFYEHGDCPLDKGTMEKKRWADSLQAAKEGRMDDIDPQIVMCHYGTIKRIKMDYRKQPNDLDRDCIGIWYYGETGTGKSRRARFVAGNSLYVKMLNKWWDGYADEETVLIEEISPEHKWLGCLLKIWCDRYVFRAEVKCETMNIRPKRLIVTSNYTPNAVFDKEEDLNPIMRRFKLVQWTKHMDPNGELLNYEMM